MEDAIRKGRAGNRPVRVSPKRVRRHSPKMIAAQCTIIFFTVVLLVFQFIPIYITVAKSFKNLEQDFLNPYGLTFPFAWSNYEFAWDMVKSLFLNTFILAFANVFGTLALSSLGAFAFVRFKFPFKETIFTAILAIMMIPGTLTLVAQFMLVDSLSLLHTRWAVILPTIAGNSSFNIFLLRTFVFTAGLMLFMQSWNDLIWPMLVLKEEHYTIATGLLPFTTEYYRMTNSYTVPMAGYVLSSIPLLVIFFFTSKQFISGLTSGAFKM